jgi:hypothetical protein
MATTWNRELVGTVARHTGLEFKKKGGDKFATDDVEVCSLRSDSSCCVGSRHWACRTGSSWWTKFGVIWSRPYAMNFLPFHFLHMY